MNFLIPTGIGSTWDVYLSDSPSGPWITDNQLIDNWLIPAPGSKSWFIASNNVTVIPQDYRYIRIEGEQTAGDLWETVVNWITYSSYNPESTIDYNLETGTGLHMLNTDHKIVFDMGDTCIVSAVRLYGYTCSPALNTVWNVYVSSSSDTQGTCIISNWTINDTNNYWHSHTADVIESGRYIRLVGRRTSNEPSTGYNWTMIQEFQFLKSN